MTQRNTRVLFAVCRMFTWCQNCPIISTIRVADMFVADGSSIFGVEDRRPFFVLVEKDRWWSKFRRHSVSKFVGNFSYRKKYLAWWDLRSLTMRDDIPNNTFFGIVLKLGKYSLPTQKLYWWIEFVQRNVLISGHPLHWLYGSISLLFIKNFHLTISKTPCPPFHLSVYRSSFINS